MPSTRISAGEISAHVDTDGVNGWCGLRHMEHSASSAEWLLSPALTLEHYIGARKPMILRRDPTLSPALTLEHYIGVPPDEPGFIQYEPCYSPRSLHDASADRCRLRYHPTACSQTTCDIRYVIDPPHSVDVMIDAVTSRHSWPLGSLALFFATIVNAPVYEGVTFRGYEGSRHPGAGPWIHFNGHAETLGRVVHPSGVSNPELRRPQPPPPTYSDSSVRFDEPFYFGTVGRMAYAVFFPAAQHRYVRFVVNPLAPAFGGPAWDFLWLIRSPEPGKRYSLTMRVVLRPFTGVEDMLAEYHDYVGRA